MNTLRGERKCRKHNNTKYTGEEFCKIYKGVCVANIGGNHTVCIKNGKVYDVNICGGKEKYNQYPFFLGSAYKWDPTKTHEEWETSPDTYDGVKKALKVGSVEYYIDTAYGSGCEIGDQVPDYLEATKIAKELFDSIERK